MVKNVNLEKNACLCVVSKTVNLHAHWVLIFEPQHEITNNVLCSTHKCSDQPAYMRSPVRAFASRLNIL